MLLVLKAAKINYNDPIWNQDTIKASTFAGEPFLVDAISNVWTELDICVYNKDIFENNGLTTPEEFGEIILRIEDGGRILRLKDVARIELGSQNYNVVSRLEGQPTAGIAVYQLPGSNSLDVAKGVKERMAELSEAFPQGIKYQITLDTTDVVHDSINEVLKTFIEATILVVLVMFLFLQNWRAVLIPCLTIPVSLIGTLSVCASKRNLAIL